MTNLLHYQPLSLMNRWHRDLDQAFNVALGGSEPVVASSAEWTPSVDVQEESDRYLVRADVPGVAANDIEVSAEDGVLTIRGRREAHKQDGSKGFERIERTTGTFLRRFTLPDSAQPVEIKANYANGVLEIVIPKAARAEAKRIAVTTN
jgi:HSP20 family protein